MPHQLFACPPGDTDAEIRQAALRDWKNDREVRELAKFAEALGVGEIVLANKDKQDILGQYLYTRDSRQAHQEQMKPWDLSPKQLAKVNRALTRGRDVILLSYKSHGDFAATLAHELGHYINHRLKGLSFFEFGLDPEFSCVTENMRRVARFDEYFFQNKDEYYAET